MVAPFSGTDFARHKLDRVSEWAAAWKEKTGKAPTIVSVFPYEDKASAIYTELKKKDANAVGIRYVTRPLSLKDRRERWLEAVLLAARDPRVQGILVQKPAADQFAHVTGKSAQQFSLWWMSIAETIPIEKDLDGLAPTTLFRLEQEAERVEKGDHAAYDSLESFILPATAQAVVDMTLEGVGHDLALLRSKKIACIGRSVIVGKPSAYGFRILGVEAELVSSQDDLAKKLPEFDVIVSATGKQDLVQPEWIKEGAYLIDVGAPKAEFAAGCAEKAAFWTPVPRGVGPVTRACLLENLQKIAR